MRITIAIDSFKGSLTSAAAGAAAGAGVRTACPDAEIRIVPVADGGEGSAAALRAALGGDLRSAQAHNALGQEIETSLTRLGDGSTSVIESADIVGLAALGAVSSEVPTRSSSFGVGQLVLSAMQDGSRRVLIALGGTACTDGGTGLVLALGGRLWDAHGAEIFATPGENPLLRQPTEVRLPNLAGLRIDALADVTSPLLGSTGSARMFGPQKGATPGQVELLEHCMTGWADALRAATGRHIARIPGSGAAGGIGSALVALGGTITPGFERISAEVGLVQALTDADLVFTGEGRIDAQTELGKVPDGVARLARAHGARVVVALAGSIEDRQIGRNERAFDAVLPIHSGPRTLTEAMDPEVTRRELSRTAREVVHLLLSNQSAPKQCTNQPEGRVS